MTVLVVGMGCRPTPPPELDRDVAAFRTLLREVGSSPADTVCVSVATPGGEQDPSPAVLAQLRDSLPHVRALSACARAGDAEPGLVRLVAVRTSADTIIVTGEAVAEHLARYQCRLSRAGASLGRCALIAHQ